MGRAESDFLRLTLQASQIIRSLQVKGSTNFSFGDGVMASRQFRSESCAITYSASRRYEGLGLLHFFTTHSEMNRK